MHSDKGGGGGGGGSKKDRKQPITSNYLLQFLCKNI